MSKELNKNKMSKLREMEKKLYPNLNRNLYVQYLILGIGLYMLIRVVPAYFKGYDESDVFMTSSIITVIVLVYAIFTELSNLNIAKNSVMVKIQNKYPSGFIVFNLFIAGILIVMINTVYAEPIYISDKVSEIKEITKYDEIRTSDCELYYMNNERITCTMVQSPTGEYGVAYTVFAYNIKTGVVEERTLKSDSEYLENDTDFDIDGEFDEYKTFKKK